MSPRSILVVVLAATAVLHGCACDDLPSGAVETCDQSAVFGGSVATDILFVIDDSGSMAQEQDRLRLALQRFINTLAASPIANDYQVAVTNTSVVDFYGETTYASGPPGARSVPFPAGIVVAVDTDVDPLTLGTWGDFLWDSTQQFYGTTAAPRILAHDDPALVSAFERNVLQGTFGAGREQPLEAMRLALDPSLTGPGGANAGFLRPGARLAIIFLSDEDDCSGPESSLVRNSAACASQRTATSSVLTPVQDYIDLLAGRDVVLGAVVGVTCSGGVCTNTRCSTTDVFTDPPANRFLELLAPFPSTLASICDSNFDAALDQFANAVMGQTMPLVGGVADPAMLAVSVVKPSVPQTVSCEVAAAGTAGAATADAVYTPPGANSPATLTFQNDCALAPGDQVEIHLICAG